MIAKISFLGANPAIRFNLFFGEKPQKRIFTAIGARAFRFNSKICLNH